MTRPGEPADAAELEDANARFYRAFEALDIAEMDRVWAHGGHVRCVHPGWPLLTVNVGGDLGWVTCTENILSEVGGRVSVTAILATNLFERGRDGWRLVHHHASHVPAPAA